MTGEKIITYLFGINALINVILLARSEQRYKSNRETGSFNQNFWQVYLYIVPFFVTNRIIREIENKKEKQRIRNDLLAKDYERFINSWKIAAIDLKIKIQSPFVVKFEDKGEFKFSIFIEHFGSKLGTIVFSTNDKVDFKLPKEYGYYCTVLNPSVYSDYKRDLFIDTLNEWGFFGDLSNKPDWYK